jgi:hypothetical protein
MGHDKDPPGSWLRESDEEPRIAETCIFAGQGLPESSPLVVRGREEQEERNEAFSNTIKTVKKNLHTTLQITEGACLWEIRHKNRQVRVSSGRRKGL